MPKLRRVVEMNRGKPGTGGRPRVWAYDYRELARVFRMSEGAVRQAVRRKRFDPAHLESVLAFAARRLERSPPLAVR